MSTLLVDPLYHNAIQRWASHARDPVSSVSVTQCQWINPFLLISGQPFAVNQLLTLPFLPTPQLLHVCTHSFHIKASFLSQKRVFSVFNVLYWKLNDCCSNVDHLTDWINSLLQVLLTASLYHIQVRVWWWIKQWIYKTTWQSREVTKTRPDLAGQVMASLRESVDFLQWLNDLPRLQKPVARPLTKKV